MRPFLHTALRLAAVSVLILWPLQVWGQSQLPQWQASIAKVSVDPKLGRTPGTAFVVAVSGQTAFLVTCAHVVVEESSPRVEFRAAPLREFRATVRAREPGDNPRGLALLVVENVPAEVTALPLAATANPVEGERVIVAGFPRPSLRFLVLDMILAGYEGQDLTLSRETVEGFSGGPVLRGDSAIGIVYGREGGTGVALISDVVRTYLRGLRVPLDAAPRTAQPAVQPSSGPKAGETRVNPVSGLKDVWIPSGAFTMGCSEGDTECYEDEKPAHPVTITKGFWMGQTEVTVGAYKRFSTAKGKPMPPEPDLSGRALNPGWKNEEQPVVNVTFQEAADYCAWAGRMRLPTEAEWEYAARAGSREARYGNLDDIVWYADNSGNQRIDSARIWKEDQKNYANRLKENGNGLKMVGQKLPNAWKLYDMLGNVWEWTADWYGEKHYQAKESRDPKGPPGETYRVLRGGSWYFYPMFTRASYRIRNAPANRSIDSGFRCAGE
ncbi:MAG: SUMF1/EgtB/PvdO family nonheme iron enzyme [Bryobacterales bacterium]|nr:SUMF1/EgtB/PvdO family nonheme iron enzyme [Bryobacterales bacterium]